MNTRTLTTSAQRRLSQKQQRPPLHFAKYGAVLILGRTNTFRTLAAEAFLRSAIERRYKTAATASNDKINESNEDEADFAAAVASAAVVAPPSLCTVVSAGREHVPAKNATQLHPLAKKLLLTAPEFKHKIDPAVVDSLWCKCSSSLLHQSGQLRTFDVVISILDADGGDSNKVAAQRHVKQQRAALGLSSSMSNASTAASFDAGDIEDDDDDNDSGLDFLLWQEEPKSRMRRKKNHDEDDNDNNNSEQFLPPGVSATMPAHWSVSRDAATTRRRTSLHSPRDADVSFNDSTLRYQDDYAGEPQFEKIKPLLLPASIRRLRWYLPTVVASNSGGNRGMAMETERDWELRALDVLREIDRMCDALLVVAGGGGDSA